MKSFFPIPKDHPLDNNNGNGTVVLKKETAQPTTAPLSSAPKPATPAKPRTAAEDKATEAKLEELRKRRIAFYTAPKAVTAATTDAPASEIRPK